MKLRYKRPDNLTFGSTDDPKDRNYDSSTLVQFPLKDEPVLLTETSNNFRFAAAVAEFGMLLRNSQHKGNSNFTGVEELAKNAIGNDEEGYRKEFLKLVEKAAALKQKETVKAE